MGDAYGGVDVDRCQDGFARFFGMPNDPERFESEQFFARWDSGGWVVIDSGTGLACDDPGNPPDLAEACAALGLSS
jgi:hypothetical protein